MEELTSARTEEQCRELDKCDAAVLAVSMTMIPALKNARGTLAKAQAERPESLGCRCRVRDGFCRMHFPMFSRNSGGDGVGSGQ